MFSPFFILMGRGRLPFSAANSVHQKSRDEFEVSFTASQSRPPPTSRKHRDCGTLVIEYRACLLETQLWVITAWTQIPFHWMLSDFCHFSFLSRPAALWENVMKFWSGVHLKKKRRRTEKTLRVILFWSIWNHSRKRSNRTRWHLVPRSKWTILYVCPYNTEREQTAIPSDKRVCLASKLRYLAPAKIPFTLDNVRVECEKDAWMREEHSCNEIVNLSTVLWEQWGRAARELCWTTSTDAMSRKYCDRNAHLLYKL